MAKKFNKKFTKKIYCNKNNFYKVVEFYVFECPIDGVSKRGSKMNEFGWETSSQFKRLKKLLISNSSLEKESTYKCYRKKTDLKDKLNEFINIYNNNEICVFYKTDSNSEIRSLIKMVRNALAHGNFVIRKYNNEIMYYMEGHFNSGGTNSILYLKEETLLKWIKVIENKK